MFETTKWLKLEARLEARLEAWYRPTNRACKLPTTQLENSLHSIPTGSSYTTTKLQPSWNFCSVYATVYACYSHVCREVVYFWPVHNFLYPDLFTYENLYFIFTMYACVHRSVNIYWTLLIYHILKNDADCSALTQHSHKTNMLLPNLPKTLTIVYFEV